MKFLKGLLIFVVILVLIIVVITLFLPGKSSLERTKLIQAPKEVVFNQVNNLKNWEEWSHWHRVDTNMNLTYSSDQPIGDGAWYKWSGNDEVGQGEYLIQESYKNDSIISKMTFMDQWHANSNWYFDETDAGTEVRWTYHSDAASYDKWYTRAAVKWSHLFMGDALAEDYDLGLNNLDSVATSLPAGQEYTFEQFQLDDTWYVGYMIETDQAGVSNPDHYSHGFGSVGGFLGMKEVSMTGAPRAIVHEWSPEKVVMEMAIPVGDSLAVPDSLTVGKIPAGPAVRTEHVGGYQGLEQAWNALEKHLAEHNFETRWYPYEVYVTDPGEQPDSTKWVTQIVFPVK